MTSDGKYSHFRFLTVGVCVWGSCLPSSGAYTLLVPSAPAPGRLQADPRHPADSPWKRAAAEAVGFYGGAVDGVPA